MQTYAVLDFETTGLSPTYDRIIEVGVVLVENDTAALMARLRSAGIQTLATTLDGDINLDEVDDMLQAPTAWIFGPEAHGLTGEIAAAADRRVTIPMAGAAESLNVAVAAAICLYQSARVQRRR